METGSNVIFSMKKTSEYIKFYEVKKETLGHCVLKEYMELKRDTKAMKSFTG